MKGEDEIIKEEIRRLHDRGSGNYEQLISQVETRKRKIRLNLPQVMAMVARQKNLFLEWGRGTGKTTHIGLRINQLLNQMPRSTGLFIGPSYQAILTRIVPSLIQGLEMIGIYQNLHYFIGRQPPPSWRKSWVSAFQPPKRWNNYISFWNGLGIHLISQDVAGDGRGLNTDFIIGDEAGLLSAQKLQENTDPTLRGTNTHAFVKKPLFGSKMYSSSTPLTPEGQWFIEMEEKAKETPDLIAFISATCKHNMHNLRPGYLDEARQNALSLMIYLAEYENVRPAFSKNSFYGLLDDNLHCYTNEDNGYYQQVGQEVDCRGDADLVKAAPLIVGVDWGAAINCLTVSQHIKSVNEFRTIKDFFVLGEDKKIQDDLFKNFSEYYKPHQASNKRIELHYDQTGNNQDGRARKTRAEQARDQLVALGWEVSLLTTGHTNPQHALKHLLWETMMKEDHPHLPRYRINKLNAKNTYLSMRNAKTKSGSNGQIKKDKSIERSKKVPRQHATDLSDAQDAAVFQRFYRLLRFGASTLPGMRTSN
jgi:hypothetical protein